MSEVRRFITTHGALSRIAPRRPVAPYYLEEPPVTILNPGFLVYANGVTWNPGAGEGIYYYDVNGEWQPVGAPGVTHYTTSVDKANAISLGEPAPFDQVQYVTVSNDEVDAGSFIILERDSLEMQYSGFFVNETRAAEFDLAWDDAQPAAARWSNLSISYVILPLAARVVNRERVTTDGDTRITTDGDRRVTEEEL